MDDLYCPSCRLVLYRRRIGQVAPAHCPRCVALRRRLVALLPLDVAPLDRVVGAAVTNAGPAWLAKDHRERSRHGASGIAAP
jgi:hypothetical protein